MNREPLVLHFAYSQWATDKLLAALQDLEPEQLRADPGLGVGSIWGLLSHLIAAEEVWLTRIAGRSLTSLPDHTGLPDLAAMAAALRRRQAETYAFVASLDARVLDRTLAYTSTSGRHFRQPVWQILLHLANHATDHRSQIGAALNYFGMAAPELDMIYYLRSLPPSPPHSGEEHDQTLA